MSSYKAQISQLSKLFLNWSRVPALTIDDGNLFHIEEKKKICSSQP